MKPVSLASLFSKGTRALREDISKNCEGLVELNLIFQHYHRLSLTNSLLWNMKKKIEHATPTAQRPRLPLENMLIVTHFIEKVINPTSIPMITNKK